MSIHESGVNQAVARVAQTRANMVNKTILLDPGSGVSVRSGGLSAEDGYRTFAVGGLYRQACNRSARMVMRSRILQLAFSLMLVSAPIALAQINHDHTNGMRFASGGCGPDSDSASRCVSVGDGTNQHLALRLVPAPKCDPAGLSYSMPPNPERGVAELNQPSLTSRFNHADPALAASPHGWRIGGAGVLNYTAPNQRWRFVVGYAPDIGALRETFGDLHSFSLAWQYSLGKRKPASWVGVKAGSEYLHRPAPR